MNGLAAVYRSPHAGRLLYQWLFVFLALVCLAVAGPALAKRTNGGLVGGIVPTPVLTPAVVPPQFDITGFIQDATVAPVGTMCPSVTEPRLMGGTVTLNGQKITVPCNTILQMPAYALTWADLVTLAPKDITPAGKTGLALSDPLVAGTNGLLNSVPTNYNAALPSHEIHVVGNVVNGEYIAGLIFISQQSLNGGQGVISCIDYATGELQVGGTVQAAGSPCPALAPGVTRVRMNDPVGRYGIVHGGPGTVGADVIEAGYDPRFTADTDNPTMHSTLGFPICIPSINPVNSITDPNTGATIAAGLDPLCPVYNRPIVPNCKNFDPLTTLPAFGGQAAGYCMTWVMDPPGARAADVLINGNSSTVTDPTVAAPLMPGDTIQFSGTMKADANGPYISAHTIAANLGIYTHPHTKPAYVFMEGVLVGTGGGTVGGLAVESTSKVSWVGFTTDPTELVDFYAVHQDPATGASSEFYLGTQDPCCTPLGRFRTPANNIGAFGEPQRNYRAVSRTMCQPDGVNGPLTPKLLVLCHMDPLTAPDASARQVVATPQQNGLIPGQYTLPNFEFIFAENLNFGAPLIPNNFQDLPFLFCGSGPIAGTGSAIVGQLEPAPWAPPMADPVFHSTLCPWVKAVDGTPGSTVTSPAPLPPTINSVTATPPSTTVGTTTTVTLSVSATNPNAGTTMSYSWVAPAGVVMSCGVCLPNANNGTVTATFTPTTAGPMTFSVKVSNGVLPDATGSVIVNVASLNAKPPSLKSFKANLGSVNAGQLVTLTAVGNTNPTGGTVSFTFTQTGGAPVKISTITVTGTAPNDQTGTTTFVAPVSLTKQNLTFQATVKDNATGLTTTGSATQVSVTLNPVPSDTVTITGVNYRSTQTIGGQLTNVGKLTITATSSATNANPPPAGMTMTAFYINSSLPASVPGSTALPLSMELTLQAADLPGTITPVCGATPCWTGSVVGVISNTSVTPAVNVPPTAVTVKSSLLGQATMTNTDPLFVVK